MTMINHKSLPMRRSWAGRAFDALPICYPAHAVYFANRTYDFVSFCPCRSSLLGSDILSAFRREHVIVVPVRCQRCVCIYNSCKSFVTQYRLQDLSSWHPQYVCPLVHRNWRSCACPIPITLRLIRSGQIAAEFPFRSKQQ